MQATTDQHADLEWGGEVIPSGHRQTFWLDLPPLYGFADTRMGVQIIRGVRPGPQVLICGGIHGDELNGAEIIRKLLLELEPTELAGTIIAVPIVNVFGLISGSRYLPDRRDLNRSFPGSPTGSLAGRLAHFFLTEVVEGCSHVIDYHSASLNRTNLPQVRADLGDPETRRCARAFGAPVIMTAPERPGSFRSALAKRGIKCLLYEAGSTKRFNDAAVKDGVAGTLRVLNELVMIDRAPQIQDRDTLHVEGSTWVRASIGGFFHGSVHPGDCVEKGHFLGKICDSFGENVAHLHAPIPGVVLGSLVDPRVNQGDAIVHLGTITQ
jgi:predicted deacylase